MEIEAVKKLIEDGIPESEAHVTGDGCNLEAQVISPSFAGKTPIQKQRMVMDTCRARIESNEIHALSIKCFTPEQWAEQAN
jgi:acid stress-induced BolA-like protein IbaG/YrbA